MSDPTLTDWGVTLPLHVRDFYHSGVGLYGAIFSAFAVGSILATLVVGQLQRILAEGWDSRSVCPSLDTQ